VTSRSSAPCIFVLAGTNGAGKSSVAGAFLRSKGGTYLNPDETTRRISSDNPGMSLDQANSLGWQQGKRLLERAIEQRLDFAFETTLGGRTITNLLEQASASDIELRMWYVGLRDPEMHIARVKSRVAHGGHDIPSESIRQRFVQSRLNLIRLLPKLTELWLYDNSEEADPKTGRPPAPRLLLHFLRGTIVKSSPLSEVPEWAKPILIVALRLAK
jgi:predicted ABC-type ATPase